MAINPVRFNPMEFPANPTPVPINFSALADIGSTIGAYRQQQAAADILRGATDESGRINYDKATAGLAAAGLHQYAEPFLQAGLRQQALAQTGAAQAETGRHNRATEEALRTGKIPFGWEIGPDGQPFYSKGGPADPEYLAKLAELKQKPREFSATDVGKLTEEGGKLGTITGFGETFKDKYAGYISPTAGELANYAGRFLPKSVVGENVAEASSWWQNYDRWKNVVRHEQYGASLQPNETVLFEKADVNPGMQPDQIRKNLAEQQRIVRAAATRKANALIAAGFDPAPIAAAYGLDLRELGANASGRRGTVVPTPTTTAPGGNIPPPPPGFIMR